MSDAGSSVGSNEEFENSLMYQCRKCPGKYFTAAEKDIHRQYHRNQKNQETPAAAPKKMIGPKSKTKPRASSPVGSLFNPVVREPSSQESSQEPSPIPSRRLDINRAKKKRSANEENEKVVEAPQKKIKIRSNKRINKDNVSQVSYPGG